MSIRAGVLLVLTGLGEYQTQGVALVLKIVKASPDGSGASDGTCARM